MLKSDPQTLLAHLRCPATIWHPCSPASMLPTTWSGVLPGIWRRPFYFGLRSGKAGCGCRLHDLLNRDK